MASRPCLLWTIIFSLLTPAASAWLDMWLIRPAEEFLTNNSNLVVEGVVESPDVKKVAVTVRTPAGVSGLGALEASIRSVVVDLGDSHSLTDLVLSPVFVGELSLGPRVVNLSFSQDGLTFEDAGSFNCTSGMGREFGEARAEFGATIRARRVQIDMLDGWQADGVSIQEVEFLDATGQRLGARVKAVSVALDLGADGEARFQMSILLKEGENQISVSAKALDLVEDVEEEFALILATYLPEVVVEEEVLTLSDGYKAELAIPMGALEPEIRKIILHPLNVDEIEWSSYLDNLLIAKGTFPVQAYEFEVRAATPFPATAKDSLQRQPPGLAVDGNPLYPSTWMTTVSALPVWLKIDLREPHPIGRVIITARVTDGASFGPRRLSVLVSDNDAIYREAGGCDGCDDSRTEITLPASPTARYVQIVVEEGWQGNNIQINEVEFRDDEGARILSYMRLGSTVLRRPAELTLIYDDSDLIDAGVTREGNLAIFKWNAGMQEWEVVGGKVDAVNNRVSVNLNHLSAFALFEAVPVITDVRWSHNPFSPNGDGVADTTTIYINVNGGAAREAKVEIFDYTSKRVQTLVYEEMRSGHISIQWDGTDENGDRVSIGPYIYQVVIGNEIRNGVLIVAR